MKDGNCNLPRKTVDMSNGRLMRKQGGRRTRSSYDRIVYLELDYINRLVVSHADPAD
eukprot:COSAG01_NODE_2472_length_7625_cov_9.664895_6_plen_57_part_00